MKRFLIGIAIGTHVTRAISNPNASLKELWDSNRRWDDTKLETTLVTIKM